MPYMPDASLAYYSNTNSRGETIAYTVDVAQSLFEKVRGRMFTKSIDTDYALVFPFDSARPTSLHMMCVPYDLGAVWIEDNIVQKVTVLDAWTGSATGRGDCIIEAHPETIADISEGDYVFLQGDHSITQLNRPNDIPTEPWYRM